MINKRILHLEVTVESFDKCMGALVTSVIDDFMNEPNSKKFSNLMRVHIDSLCALFISSMHTLSRDNCEAGVLLVSREIYDRAMQMYDSTNKKKGAKDDTKKKL